MGNKIFKHIFFILSFLYFKGYSQELSAIVKKIDSLNSQSTEKLYMHIDRPHYLAGETLWFSLYNLSYKSDKISSISSIAYVEILDFNQRPLSQTMVELENGRGSGNVNLTKNLSSGTYIIRAYTRAMRNQSQRAFFETTFELVNSFNSITREVKALDKKYDIQFYAEGGDFIENLNNIVAFKILGRNGKGLSVKGVIVSNKGDTITKIETLNSGIGRFSMLPKKGETYRAIFLTDDKKIITGDLPYAKKQGYSLSLIDEGDSWTIDISSNTSNKDVYSIVHNGKKVSYAKFSTLKDGKASFEIDKGILDEGLHHLTIFDSEKTPVAERIFMKRKAPNLKLKMDLSKTVYFTRDNVDISLYAETIKGLPKSATLSASVYKLDSLSTGDDSNIISYLYLESELKNVVENPYYYFSESSLEKALALDNLLITQGWRRFKSKDKGETQKKILDFIPEKYGNLISGNITDVNGRPKKNSSVYLSIPKKAGFFHHTTSDSLGKFTFLTKKLFEDNEIILQTNSKEDTVSKISIDNPFYEGSGLLSAVNSNNFIETSSPDLRLRHFALQIQEAYNKPNKIILPIQADKEDFYGMADKTYFLADYTKFKTLEEVLREYVSEVYVSKKQKEFNFRMVNGTQNLESNPLLLLDGIPYFDANKMLSVSPDSIERLDVVPHKYYYNGKSYEGIIHFHSKRADLSDYELNPNAVIVDYEGLQLQREFYLHTYENDENFNSSVADYRLLLYWNPSLGLEVEKKTIFKFFTSDVRGKFRIVIQGISEDGSPLFVTKDIEVKK